jgi:paraquat-inducible protein A
MSTSSALAGRYVADGLIACHSCDGLHRIAPVPEGGKALCTRCGALLYRNVANSLDRSAALYLSAFLLFLLANLYPIIGLKVGDRVEQTLLVSGALALHRQGMGELGLLVLLTSVVFPLLTIGGMLYVLLPLRLGQRPPGKVAAWRMVRALSSWSLIGVFMLALLVSVVKLQDIATIVPGIGLYAFVGLLCVSAAAAANFDPSVVWPRVGPPAAGVTGGSAAAHGFAACHACDLLVPLPGTGARGGYPGEAECPRCGSTVHGARIADSSARTWALVISATLLLVPANLYPVMTVMQYGAGEPSTILAGVVHLIEAGMWPLAMLVFFASFVVPFTKIAVLVLLLVTVRRGTAWRVRDRSLLYRVVEAVGAWSMVDVFLVGILVALVQMDALARVLPGIGVTFFAASVVLTIFAAHSFDPRLVWDRAGRGR